MSWETHIPDGLKVAYQWTTNILVSRNGTEQRIAVRQTPRTEIGMQFLSDSYEDIQRWRFEMFSSLDNVWSIPLWTEAEKITAAVAATDTTIAADYTLMDDTLGSNGSTGAMMLLHPDGETYEIHQVTLPRAAGLSTLSTGSIANNYPLGSTVVPVEVCFIDNNSGYSAEAVNAAHVSVGLVAKYSNTVVGKGAAAIGTYLGVEVLDRRSLSEGAQDTFWERLTRLDYGHKIQVKSEQTYSNIGSARQYKISTKEERQWWKLFLATVKGRQKTFYCSTYREDMTVVSQPAVGGYTFTIDDAANVVGGWVASGAHQSLAIETADGVLQYRTLYTPGTVDNGDGTHTIYVTAPFVPTVEGSTIVKVSFLELVRLGEDTVSFTHDHDGSTVAITVRTIITPVVPTYTLPPTSTAYSFGARPFGLRTFGPNNLDLPLAMRNFGSRTFGTKTFGSV